MRSNAIRLFFCGLRLRVAFASTLEIQRINKCQVIAAIPSDGNNGKLSQKNRLLNVEGQFRSGWSFLHRL